MAVDALRLEEPEHLIEEGDIVDMYGQLDMTRVAGARPRVQATSSAAKMPSACGKSEVHKPHSSAYT